MKNYCPIAFVIDYSDLLNECLIKFIDDYNHDFTMTIIDNHPVYTYSGPKQLTYLTKIFNNYIDNTIDVFRRNIETRYSDYDKKIIFILSTSVAIPDQLRYAINEPDIYLDLNLFDKCWTKIFNSRFKKMKVNQCYYVQHNELTVNYLIKILKLIYGTHLRLDYSETISRHFLIDSTSNLTLKINKTKAKLLIDEVKQLIISLVKRG